MKLRLALLLTISLAAGCSATAPTPPVARVDDAAPAINAQFDQLGVALSRAAAEQRSVLVLIAPAVRCCAEPGRTLTPALDLWRNDAELQRLSSRFVVVELTEDSLYSFLERCGREGYLADSLSPAWFNDSRPMPGAYRVAPDGKVIGSTALDTSDARERLLALLAN